MNSPHEDFKNVSNIVKDFGENLSHEQLGTLVRFMQKYLEEIKVHKVQSSPKKKKKAKLKEKYYTATAIERIYGIPKSVVGTIANRYGLKKTNKYGIQSECVDAEGNVWPSFKYNEAGKEKIFELYQQIYTN